MDFWYNYCTAVINKNKKILNVIEVQLKIISTDPITTMPTQNLMATAKSYWNIPLKWGMVIGTIWNFNNFLFKRNIV